MLSKLYHITLKFHQNKNYPNLTVKGPQLGKLSGVQKNHLFLSNFIERKRIIESIKIKCPNQDMFLLKNAPSKN